MELNNKNHLDEDDCIEPLVVTDEEKETNSNEGEPNITDILTNINKNNVKSSVKKDNNKKKSKVEVPRGQPKSGRCWKTPKQKFSKIKTSIHRRTFPKKEELRADIKHIKDISRTIVAERNNQNKLRKERRAENIKRKLENEQKSEVVQIIKNPNKIKRMRKKQLRMIEKRDLSKIKVV